MTDADKIADLMVKTIKRDGWIGNLRLRRTKFYWGMLSDVQKSAWSRHRVRIETDHTQDGTGDYPKYYDKNYPLTRS